ncbi:hypothetical protein CLV92_10133 [Kineococcus xinjiangensis]|uniref:Uncharacterized protein n=1 Tax=Kineococcus xinjiangensis TaxID=512762 RepID=A0A2S6IVG3_9ACTN|nr:hypothetical protein CLV92_10133 [Kineococcus xinjiangensis]
MTKASSGEDEHIRLNSRCSFACLMDRVGSTPPTASSVAGARLLRQGTAHMVTITHPGGEVLGNRDLAPDGITGLVQVSDQGGGTVWLHRGPRRLRPATVEEARRSTTGHPQPGRGWERTSAADHWGCVGRV